MRRRTVLAVLLAVANVAATASAQGEDGAALLKKADEQAVAALHARADALAEQKQYARALALRQEIVGEFAPGDSRAMQALGFVGDAGGWHRDANKAVPDKDLKGEAKVLKKLDQDWERTQKDLAKLYEKAATVLAAAGPAEVAGQAWRRLLRFRPGDAKASAAMQLVGFDGFVGTPAELALLRKGRAIRQAVEFLKARTVPCTPIVGRTQPLFETAKVPAKGFQTEHFEFWGTLPDDKLQLAAQWAERALLLSRMLFGTESGEAWRPAKMLPFCWVNDRKVYQQVLDAHARQFPDKERLRFLKEDVELAFVASGPTYNRLLLDKSKGDDELLDQTVRGVVQDAVGLKADGLWEGLGHAVCGFCFNQTLTFFVEQQKGRTVTAWQPRPLVPDMKVWMEIAAESAWSKSDTPTSRLVTLSGAKFTNEERVKAWAMADYLLRLRPELLMELDLSRPEGSVDPGAVESEFHRRTQLSSRKLDDDWRDYWGKGQALRTAMAAQPRGDKDQLAGAKAIATAINEARAAAERGPLGWTVADGVDVQAAHKWLDAYAKTEKDLQKVPKPDVQLPAAPECVGRSVLLARGAEPAAAVAQWLLLPGARDLLLHPGRILIGASKGKLGIALDLAEPQKASTKGLPLAWPRAGQAIAPACTVQQLSPWLQELLAAKGKQPGDEVGTPLSLHFSRELSPLDQSAVTCRVTADREEVDGVFACAQRDGSRADTAAGCFVFVPLSPLPKNRQLAVEWSVPPGLLAKREKYAAIPFTVQ